MAAAGKKTQTLRGPLQTDTVQKSSCGGSQGMEPMHRATSPDSRGMDRLAHRSGGPR
jgi:hypothetical protein